MNPSNPEHTPIGPVDATKVPRYAEPTTFARLPRLDEVARADVTILGVPFDFGVSYRPGARFGPGHIRAASKLLRPYNPALQVSPFARQQVADFGDIGVNPFDITEALTTVHDAVTDLRADGSSVLTLGGDHTIALPILRSLARDHGPVAVLHFDAHLDTWDTYFGAPYTHGTPFRRASEEGLIDLERSQHIGIRGPLYSERRGQHRRTDASTSRRRSGLRLCRHRRPRPRACTGHRHSGGRRDDLPRTVEHAARTRRPERGRCRHRGSGTRIRPCRDNGDRGGSRRLRAPFGTGPQPLTTVPAVTAAATPGSAPVNDG